MHPLAKLDHAYVWHPFTQMQDWLSREPIVLTAGRGAVLKDVYGHTYLDANSSIWTNLHGHNHPRLNAAVRRQLARVAHTSALGFANEPASQLAARLVEMAKRPGHTRPDKSRQVGLSKVFFSDDGSTAIEAALKLAHEYIRRTRGPKPKPRFLAMKGAYHGDTIGAVSLSHSPRFHRPYSDLVFKSDTVMAPYCYRCPFNQAKPERADARTYRRCNWECVAQVENKLDQAKKAGRPYSVFIFEPRLQGAAGMIPQPDGWLKRVADLMRARDILLVADEVMTGFGRTSDETSSSLFASLDEQVSPDFLCLAKGLTGGYMPMAATLTTRSVFDAFLGKYEEFKTFFHGHSFTANPLGAATSLANLDLLQSESCLRNRRRIAQDLKRALTELWASPNVGDIRQVGLVGGVELVRNWVNREPFELDERVGDRVCEQMRRHGVLTRPIGNVVVLMPPYCATSRQIKSMVDALRRSIAEVMPPPVPRALLRP